MQEMEQTADIVHTWKTTAATVLDVRPELEQGGEPFVQIMEAAGGVPAGASLVIIAPFEPAPLYGALGSQGFSHETQRVAANEWVIRFTRQQ